MFLSGCRSVLMRLTIQLKSLPYSALDMASRTSAALSTVLARTIVSPRVTTQYEIRASWSSSGLMQRTEAAAIKGNDDNRECTHPSIHSASTDSTSTMCQALPRHFRCKSKEARSLTPRSIWMDTVSPK